MYRVAAIQFLNAAPLMWRLDEAPTEHEPAFQLSYTLPSACADALRGGTADLGVIPVIELGRIPGLLAVDGLGVTARAHVRSILLLSRVPLSDVRRLRLDGASRTSSALAQILLRHRFGARFQLVEPLAGHDWRGALSDVDALLVIGDPALRLSISGEVAAAGFAAYDLATLWHGWTGLPFVFALWGVREAALSGADAAPHLVRRLTRALAEGERDQEQLVTEWSGRLHLPAQEIRAYLRHDVEYHLEASHHQSLKRFFELAAADGLLAAARLPRFLNAREGVEADAAGRQHAPAAPVERS